MKEIKAFVRVYKVDRIIEALQNLGITDFTVGDVMGVGKHLEDLTDAEYSMEIIKKYSKISKLELVCRADKVQEIIAVLRKEAYTGMKGDGIIYVTPVETVVKIRTGAINSDAL